MINAKNVKSFSNITIDNELAKEFAKTKNISRIFWSNDVKQCDVDVVIRELPLQVRLSWQRDKQEFSDILTITMRTPGDDIELVLGILFSESVICDLSNIESICYEDDIDAQGNQIEVRFREGTEPDITHSQRQLISTSSCGLCGKSLLQTIEMNNPPKLDDKPGWLSRETILQLGDKLKSAQQSFALTGGAHGAALFDHKGELELAYEDIGRHNALDKLIGAQIQGNCCPTQKVVMVSSRLSYELVQKTIMAGWPVLIAVGAPSDLAIEAAKRFGLTLIGFARGNSFNLYNGDWRIAE